MHTIGEVQLIRKVSSGPAVDYLYVYILLGVYGEHGQVCLYIKPLMLITVHLAVVITLVE